MVALRYPEAAAVPPPTDGVMELSFLISRTQFEALEQSARGVNMSVAQYLRRLVQSSVDQQPMMVAESV